MNLKFTFFSFFIVLYSFSQTNINGIITSKNIPLEGASVYLNNTTIGTITDEKGAFELNFKEGNYTLVVSFLGYKTYQKSINTINQKKIEITISLEEDNEFLDEVEIKKIVYDDEWKYNLARFKQAFLGKTKLASTCKILNEKDLFFDFNYKTNTLSATARKPLKIKHNGLGYLIEYDLINFELGSKTLFFSGYAQYKNLRKSIRKKWKKNRNIAYNGSRMHFLRSLLNKELKEDGFVINKFRRVANKERPSEEKIRFARKYLKLHGNRINYSRKIEEPKTTLDSAIVIANKARLPKYRDYLYKRDVPVNEMISFQKTTPFLDFTDYLMIIYTKEPEEENYVQGIFGKKRKQSDVQTSHLVLLQGKSEIDKIGIMINPNAVFNEGYWSFESFANMLPLNYQPSKK
ncbi:carboxypeptidase-like regulatory domain-containing protein [Tenacibaculum sp. ZS6-P6]|uniref:carboxypeptidase-like regulatory domain-containing protein n=1 Tax=Tenacibaculum sp. ZS6-P6 TaxID=3447503 RepID=UPI003F9C70D4